jgi:tRNA-specific 2-thiouridylase
MSITHKNISGERVVIGLSGGVDSAVAALLLKQDGADVHALHMTNWEDDAGYCTAAADLQDARLVCEQLQVPLHHVNFAREYRDKVFEHFLQEYRAGRTPNPDVLCNREIKFGVFREYAHRLGARFLATGHYARTCLVDGTACLCKAADAAKDQSYFLHAVSAEALAETLFPLGELQKSEVRRLARDHGLPVHAKKDSTGICFIGERPFREFLATHIPARPGPMVTPDGETVGEHQGLMFYTIGQRQGLGLGGKPGATEEPWYVAAKDLQSNSLLVVQGDSEILYEDRIEVGDVHWIQAPPAALQAGGVTLACKIRYRQEDQICVATRTSGDRLQLAFEEPQRAVAPGQFAVFYDGEQCLGGGVIENTLSRSESRQSIMRPRAGVAQNNTINPGDIP